MSDDIALKYLKKAFNIPTDDAESITDALNVLAFFKKCKLAHVFEGKVLLAHGGGFDPNSFFNQAYVDSFIKESSDSTFKLDGDNYLVTLEEFRKRLSTDELDNIQIGGGDIISIDGKTATRSERNPDSSRTRMDEYAKSLRIRTVKAVKAKAVKANAVAPEVKATELVPDIPIVKSVSHRASNISESVDAYNNLLDVVLKEINDGKFTKRFVLLQALGLKPDKEDARYNSLIQSCSQDGCVGPTNPLSNDKEGKILARVLTDSNITHVSYGHKPVCFPIPLIYQRATIPGVTFISNDTSNGNRKILEIGENAVIGTSITIKADGNHVSQVETISLDGKEDSPAKTKYESMFNPFSTKNPPPLYETASINLLKYPTKKDPKKFNRTLFKLKGPYDQLVYVNAGGRRRSRNRKRNTKRVSRYISKRTRRNKKTMRGRKIRKY